MYSINIYRFETKIILNAARKSPNNVYIYTW